MPVPVSMRTVQEALTSAGASVLPTSGGRIPFSLRNGSLLCGEAAISDHWISLHATPEDTADQAADGKQMWSSLEQNGRMQSPVRLAVDYEGRTSLRADIPSQIGDNIRQELVEACEAMKASHGNTAAQTGSVAASKATPGTNDQPKSSGETFLASLGTAPWNLTLKGDRVHADLDVPGQYVQARIQPREGDGFKATVLLLSTTDRLPDICRHAIALFLLTVSAMSRGVRPVAHEAADRIRIDCELDSRLRKNPQLDLDRALSSLSVAVGLCAREVQALTNEVIAAAYVGARDVTHTKR